MGAFVLGHLCGRLFDCRLDHLCEERYTHLMDNALILENHPLILFFVFTFGLIWGSFFNVCILRLPLDKSLIPPSHCVHCKTKILWYHNVPVLSFLWLKGKCAACKTKISLQYPLVEVATAFLFLWLFYKYGLTIRFFSYTVFASALLVISVIDLHHQIIPDEISLPGIVVGFVFALITHDLVWWESLLGAFLGGGVFFLVAWGYELITKREGLGGGDVKLLAMIGAWLGYQSLLPVIILSSALGSVVGIVLMLRYKKDLKAAIPFGPFLAAAALLYLQWGEKFQALLFPDMASSM